MATSSQPVPTSPSPVTSAGTYTNGASATNLVNNQVVCFRAKNSSNVYGYSKIRVDLVAPTIHVTQTGGTLSGTTPAPDLPTTPVWQHSLPSANKPYAKPYLILVGSMANS